MLKRWLKYAAVILFFAAIIYVIRESEKISLIQTFLPERIATFKNVHMTGMHGSEESWEIYAREAWTGRDKYVTTLEDVSQAFIIRNGRMMIKNLKARRVRIAKNNDIEILKKVDDDKAGSKYLRLMIDFNAAARRPKKEKKFSYITADYVKMNPDTEKATIQGNIIITKDDLRTYADKISIDLDANIATFESRTIFMNDKSRLSADLATALFDENLISLTGSVEVTQKNKIVSSETASYDDNANLITLSSNVKGTIEKPKLLIKEKTAEKYSDKDEQETLTTITVITCDKMVINTDNNDASGYGHVLVTQKEKIARSDQAVYSEASESIIMTGNVYMKKKEDWVKADKVIVSVDKESFEAIGGVETEFKVKKGSKTQ